MYLSLPQKIVVDFVISHHIYTCVGLIVNSLLTRLPKYHYNLHVKNTLEN